MSDHYNTLGVPRSASYADIRSAYRKLVLKHHPDRSVAADATKRFIEITRAYEVLSDPARRASYDRVLELRERPRKEPPRQPPTREPSPQPRPRVAAPEPRKQLAHDLLRLSALLKRGVYSEAERLAKTILETEKRHPIPYAALGDIASFRGELKRAAEMYSYALQMDPRNTVYRDRHEQMLRSINSGAETSEQRQSRRSTAWAVGAILTAAGAYLALSPERPAFAGVGLVSTWTLGLVVMFFLGGVTVGAGLSNARLLQPVGAIGGTAVAKVSPTFALALVAIVNFWAAALLYVLTGTNQSTFNPSTSRLLAGSAVVTLFLSVACGIPGVIDVKQAALWGGNIVYLGGLCGWIVADGMQH